MAIKFPFHESKALEALAFVAQEAPGLTPFFVAKILFYAEKRHINLYGRAIIGDTFIAMPQGPVPSTIKNYIDHNWDWVEKPDDFDNVLSIERGDGLARLFSRRAPHLDSLSETDVECLREAIAFCQRMTRQELSRLTHFEKAYHEAEPNQPMDYESFIDDDNPHKAEIVDMAIQAASYAVL